MGAANDVDVVWGYAHTEDGMQKAYDDACSDALYEYGHNPYNGTIATTSGVVLAQKGEYSTFKPMHYIEFNADSQFDEWPDRFGASKWGPAAAVPVFTREGADSEYQTFEITRRVPVEKVVVKKDAYGNTALKLPADFVNETIEKDVRNKFRGKEKPAGLIPRKTNNHFGGVDVLSSTMPKAVMQGKMSVSDVKRKTIEVTYRVGATVVKSYGKGEKETGWAFLSIVAM